MGPCITFFLTINLLDAVYLLSEAWEDVKSATIANCYRHAGFVKDPVIESRVFREFDVSRHTFVNQHELNK